MGSEGGRVRAAILYTVLVTAKLIGSSKPAHTKSQSPGAHRRTGVRPTIRWRGFRAVQRARDIESR